MDSLLRHLVEIAMQLRHQMYTTPVNAQTSPREHVDVATEVVAWLITNISPEWVLLFFFIGILWLASVVCYSAMCFTSSATNLLGEWISGWVDRQRNQSASTPSTSVTIAPPVTQTTSSEMVALSTEMVVDPSSSTTFLPRSRSSRRRD